MSDKKVKDTTPTPEVDENRLIAERRAKLGTLREQGIAYPNDFRKDTTAGICVNVTQSRMARNCSRSRRSSRWPGA